MSSRGPVDGLVGGCGFVGAGRLDPDAVQLALVVHRGLLVDDGLLDSPGDVLQSRRVQAPPPPKPIGTCPDELIHQLLARSVTRYRGRRLGSAIDRLSLRLRERGIGRAYGVDEGRSLNANLWFTPTRITGARENGRSESG